MVHVRPVLEEKFTGQKRILHRRVEKEEKMSELRHTELHNCERWELRFKPR